MKYSFLPALLFTFLVACQSQSQHPVVADSSVADTAPQQKNTPAAKPFVYGIDISQYQGDEVQLISKNGDSLSFIICRATLGITVTDLDFASNWKMISDKGFTRGAYHFYECDDDPIAQARHYLQVIGSLAHQDLPPILDFEQAGLAGVTNKTKIQADLLTFLDTVQKATGRVPMIYVSTDFSNAYLSNPAFGKYPLYVADYNRGTQPSVPDLWQSSGWTFWQKSDSVTVDNFRNDFDLFNGSSDQFQEFLNNK